MVTERTVELADALADLAASDTLLRASSEATIEMLAQAIEGRDIETGQHIARMSRYAALLAHGCGLDDEQCHLIRLASPMHDIGKIGVADGILFKPGTLSAAEFDVIKEHAEQGYRILAKSKHPLLQLAATIARTHHERWDGSGYPHGLAGTAIPIEGRIAAVADVFDAIVSRRVYKPAFPLDQALSNRPRRSRDDVRPRRHRRLLREPRRGRRHQRAVRRSVAARPWPRHNGRRQPVRSSQRRVVDGMPVVVVVEVARRRRRPSSSHAASRSAVPPQPPAAVSAERTSASSACGPWNRT